MSSITLPVTAIKGDNLRPLNILRDLPQVADLIEICFQSTMDDEGQSYVQQMRRASNDRDFLSWAARLMDSTSMPLAGFVWDEGGKIVGNVSLVYQTHRWQKIAMIANVATHPDYRRGGIGRALTQRAMETARQKGAQGLWLQVRHDNPTAIRIYSDLGFVERARRTTYRSKDTLPTPSASPPSGYLRAHISAGSNPGLSGATTLVRRAEARHWARQYAWLQRAHPEEISWYAHWNWQSLGPGLRNYLRRLFTDTEARHWSALTNGRLLAAVTWIPGLRTADSLWIAAPRDGDGSGTKLALETARRDLADYRKLTVEHPAGELEQAIQDAGFEAYRTLIWMRAPATAS
jgi:ribosomal protein S18 acetylase RimI-like enzyme